MLENAGLIRISESENFVVDYDNGRGMYKVSIFTNNNSQEEYWFDAYGEKEANNNLLDSE